jgi:AcrR family transcriptional regulator
VSPAGRRPGRTRTRAEILEAARAEFGERGYTAATVRQVARRADVDPALVYHYFADKAGLFVACLDLPADPRVVQTQARGTDLDGARIVERFLAQWEEGEVEPGKPFVTLTQAVSSSPEVARAVREFITERVWARVPGSGGEAVARTTALVSSQLLGAAWARYVVRMEPFASASRSEVAAWIGPTIEAYITGRLGSPADDPPDASRPDSAS